MEITVFCIPRKNNKIFICLSMTPQLTWGKVFFSENVLYQNVLLCGSANFSEFWRTKCFPPSILCCVWYYLGCVFVRNCEQNSVARQWVEDLHREIKPHKKWHSRFVMRGLLRDGYQRKCQGTSCCERCDCSNECWIFMVMKAPRAICQKSNDVKIQWSTKFCHVFSSQEMPYLTAIWCAILPSLYFMHKGGLSTAERANLFPCVVNKAWLNFLNKTYFGQ